MALATSCSGGTSSLPLSATSSSAGGGHGTTPTSAANGSHAGNSGPTSSTGSSKTTVGGTRGSDGTSGATSPQQTQVVTGSTLASRSDAINTDNSSFQSVAAATQSALKRLSSAASFGDYSQTVAPLTSAANKYQSELLNLQLTGSAKSAAQALSQRLGQLAAVLMEPQRETGFSSAAQFRTQVTAALSAVKGASSSVSSQLS